MAQIDTGLGWEVSDIWYLNNAGDIASLSYIGGPDFPGQPVPVATTQTDLVAGGFKAAYNPATGRNCDLYVGCTATGKNAVLVVWLEDVKQLGFISSIAADVHFCAYGPSYANKSNFMLTYRDPTTNLYRGTSTQVNNRFGYGDNIVPYCPSFADWDTALAAVQTIIETFSKSNEGPCAAGIVKWQTPTGTIIDSPVLISSKSEYTDMACTNSSYNLAKLNILKDGINFYMSFFDVVGNRDYQTSMTGGVNIPEDYGYTLEQVFEIVASSPYANITIANPPDPYENQTGSSGEEGGNGEEIEDDDVDFTPLPSSMAVASGFITLFCPSQYELNQLANYMWSPLFDVDTFKKLFANPMDCILGLAVYPFPISASGTKTVSVGGIATTVSMGYTLQQYHVVDCGSVYVPKQWGAYMDYAPYTRFNIFLPYIGFRSVSADDIMGKTISLRYMVDILSGACNAELKCGGSVLYSWAGSCAAQIPITGNDWRSAITSGISIAGSIAATVLTQGASAPMISGTVASATVNSMQLKPEVQRSGSISGSSGFLAGQRPYLVRTNPRSAIPANQNKYSGYPSFVTISLGSLTGYNEVYSVHLENIPATGAELDEIESILKGGAIF